MSSRHNDQSSSSRDQDHTKDNSKRQTGMSSKHNDQSSSSRDKDYKKYNSKRQSGMSSKYNDQSSSSRDHDHEKYMSKSQMKSDTLKKYKAQSPKPANKPIAFVSPQKRDDIKPMFPKPSSRRY
jgi:hypothetical protein